MNNKFFEIQPGILKEVEFHEFCNTLVNFNDLQDMGDRRTVISEYRQNMKMTCTNPSVDEVRGIVLKNYLLDLLSQGWEFSFENGRGKVTMPSVQNNGDPIEEKKRVRANLHHQRSEQLNEPSVRDFIQRMEQRRLTASGWHSIYSLMRDGRDLKKVLLTVLKKNNEHEKNKLLRKAVSPYLQFIKNDEKCVHTGIKLKEIWRYFRHTWSNPYKSVPGRHIMILIRDASCENHPVIGIAALSSAVVQHKLRDQWIGWDQETFLQTMITNPSIKYARWLQSSLAERIQSIYLKDLLRDGLVNYIDLEYPGESIINNLLSASDQAIKRHRRYPITKQNRFSSGIGVKDEDWEGEAKTQLFRSKRCKNLADLLWIKKVFQDHGFDRASKKQLTESLRSKKFQKAICALVRMLKSDQVGINLMDISVCGAIAPYNEILGGKLVCMLLCSPEINQYYYKRYKHVDSIIASSMRGGSVKKNPLLVLLGTTSLYGIGSSQYNRVKIPSGSIGGKEGEVVKYHQIGYSKGFGTFHFSKTTNTWIKNLLAKKEGGKKVNSIFGEGVNPYLRQHREALSEVKLPSDILLQHGDKRVVYGISLTHNFREILLNLDKSPKYIIPQSNAKKRTEMIVEFWYSRWLASRIEIPGILDKIEQHTLVYPIEHGAQVDLPKNEDDVELTFWD